MKSRSAARLTAGLSACLSLAACSAQRFHIPSPVPPPIHEHTIAAPFGETWAAAMRALAMLNLPPGESDKTRGSIVTDFHSREGNSEQMRNTGIARLAVERDIYSAGRERLWVSLTPVGADRTQVQVAVVAQAKVVRRGEIQYGDASAKTTEGSAEPGTDWEPLTSNGVLEDEFLAALAAELSHGRGPE